MTDEIHHADFIRRQAIHDLRRDKTESSEQERTLDELRNACDKANQRWQTVLEKHGYEYHDGESDVLHGIMPSIPRYSRNDLPTGIARGKVRTRSLIPVSDFCPWCLPRTHPSSRLMQQLCLR